MVHTRPCRICRHWFLPDPRAGDRQHVCCQTSCQRERHRRSCRAWREREQESIRTHRLRMRILAAEPEPAGAGGSSGSRLPTQRLRWGAVRDAVGLQVGVIVEEIAQQIQIWVRGGVTG